MTQPDWGGSIEEPCLAVIELKGELGEGIIGREREDGVDGGDGKRGWLCHREGHKGASPDKEEAKVRRRDVQGDAEVTVGRDYVVPMIGFL